MDTVNRTLLDKAKELYPYIERVPMFSAENVSRHNELQDIQRAAYLAGAGENNGHQYKYFIEDKRNGKWLCIGEMFDSSKDMQVQEESRWTNDPLHAVSWKTFNEAEEHNKKYFNMPDIEVTEHEFAAYTPCIKCKEREKEVEGLKKENDLLEYKIRMKAVTI